MGKIICGELKYNNNLYYFNFRDNILVIQPKKMVDYNKWWIDNFLNNKYDLNDRINIDGETNEGKYICFIDIKFTKLGRGILQSFVPAYVLGTTNLIEPLPTCTKIEKMIYEGESLDKFCYPKRIIKHNDLLHDKNVKVEIDCSRYKNKEFIIDKDIYRYDIKWIMPVSSDINNVLNVKTQLSVIFSKCKNINEVIKYYRNIEKFFCFINNRRIVKFTDIKLKKKEKVQFGNKNELEDVEIEFVLHITYPQQEIDLLDNFNCIRLDDLEKKYKKLYKFIIDDDFLVQYYPLNRKENNNVNNDKFVQVSSAFESEFRKLFPNFKSNISDEYKIIKAGILNHISNKKKRINKQVTDSNKKQLSKELKYCDYFYKIISGIDGTLEEKIKYSFNRYNRILEKKKNTLLKNYNIEKAKNTVLAKVFSNRRNKISHGELTRDFNDLEIISYILLRICIYCITLERCNFTYNEIDIMVNKIF